MLKADVEQDPNWLLETPEGVYQDANVYLTEEQYRRMRAGYICPWCFQEFKHAFELNCAGWHWGPDRETCEREWQRYMDERFGGVEWLGPSKSLLESLESPIWVPGKK